MRFPYLSGILRAGWRISFRWGGIRLLLLRVGRWLAGTSDSGGSNVVRPNIDSKVLESVAVLGALFGIFLRKCQHRFIVISMVINGVFVDGWHVQDAVQKIYRPDRVERRAGNGVAKVADRVQRSSDFERARTDNCFGSGIGSAPMACPV